MAIIGKVAGAFEVSERGTVLVLDVWEGEVRLPATARVADHALAVREIGEMRRSNARGEVEVPPPLGLQIGQFDLETGQKWIGQTVTVETDGESGGNART